MDVRVDGGVGLGEAGSMAVMTDYAGVYAWLGEALVYGAALGFLMSWLRGM